ncbi:Os05g0208250 [Oryza sativa Japonica Group]|uniref:Os05g0208250 protein n=1 Tax=Oryza sativa subsp. japonica TaxID=39947 RepID=C7J2Q3_ORYSJ|nr:Os05g0208250 [Oryza sativa Japonica Group]|eukprot:NP_001174275.1 Os05g0208250 [Oryza sativa Japonica Group]
MVSSPRPRVSVIFFAGPPPRERLAPLPWLVAEDGGRRRYREFTWREYKASAYRTKLAENRLSGGGCRHLIGSVDGPLFD